MAGRPLRQLRNSLLRNPQTEKERVLYRALKQEADKGYVQVGDLNMSFRGAAQRIEADMKGSLSSDEKGLLLRHVKEAARATYLAHVALDELGAFVFMAMRSRGGR